RIVRPHSHQPAAGDYAGRAAAAPGASPDGTRVTRRPLHLLSRATDFRGGRVIGATGRVEGLLRPPCNRGSKCDDSVPGRRTTVRPRRTGFGIPLVMAVFAFLARTVVREGRFMAT